jgi:hypothetical protein
MLFCTDNKNKIEGRSLILSTTFSNTKSMVKFFLFLFIIFSAFTSNSYVSAKDDLTGSKNEDNQNGNSSNLSVFSNNYTNMFDNIIYPQDIENYDYFELLEDETSTFMNWLAFIFDLSVDENIEFINENINKLILKAIHENIISDVFNRPQTRFTANIHSQTTEYAIAILLQDGKSGPHNLFYRFREVLMNGSILPDEDEMYSGHHYYVADSPQSDGYYQNRNGEYSISARTRFEEHYYTAINAYKNGKTTVAMNELGRALHYLQDTAATPHSSGIESGIYGFYTPHNFYENWVRDNCLSNSNYVAMSANNFYTSVLNFDNPGILLNQVAEFSSQYQDILENYGIETDNPNYVYYVNIASACLPYSQQATAAVLNRFYEDVTNSSSKITYFKDGNIYFIKNVYYSKYIDVKTWSTAEGAVTHLYNFHGDTNQQFRAQIQNDGSFYFIPVHAGDKKLHISSNLIENFNNLNITSNGTKFKPVYYKNGQFRLVPEYDIIATNGARSRYYKYNVYSEVNEIVINYNDVWTPSNSKFLWEFQEAPSVSTGQYSAYIGQKQTQKVLITVGFTGYYDIETIGNVDTYFENLKYRSGFGNVTINTLISSSSNNDGEGNNAKYSNVYLEQGKTYILTLRGYYTTSGGSFSIKVTGNGPITLEYNDYFRSSYFEITDDGRFYNPSDEIRLDELFGYSLTELQNAGYTKIYLSFSFEAHEVNDGYQYCWVYNEFASDSIYFFTAEFEHVPGSQSSIPSLYSFGEIEIDISSITNDTLYIVYGASGNSSDTWICNNLHLIIRIM